MQWTLQTLGTFRLRGDEDDFPAPPTQKARALLTYLVWHQGAELSRERVIEVFWPECDPDRGRSSLTTAFWSIRRCFREGGVDPDTVVFSNKTRVAWLPAAGIDATIFERQAVAAKDMPSMRAAIDVYGGEFLANDYTDWCVAQRERLASLYESLLSSAVALQGDVACARLLVARDWFEELPYAIVARDELRSGRIAAAAAAIEQCRRALAEVGSSPSEGFETEFSTVIQMRTTPVERELKLPFCGRTHELETLRRVLSAASNGTGAIGLVRGVSGSGKSELLWQAERIAGDFKLRVATVRALESDPRAFGPWALLYQHLTSQSFEQFIAAGGDSESLAAALRSALGSAVLIVDDAQYLSGDSYDVLARLANDASSGGLGLLIGARPTPDRRFLLVPGAIVMEIDSLTFDEIEAAIRRRASENAGPVVDFLFTRSGGHPFFAARLLESLGQSGTLRVEQGTWIFSRDPQAMQTPASIRNFIEASLYSRGKDVPLVACALALEPDATSEDVIAATGLEEVFALDAIDDLLAMGLLEQPAQGPEFRFAHDLIKEAATRALNSGRRVKIHRAYATRFSDGEQREGSARLARHLRASGQVLAAAKALRLAAYESLQVNAWHDALDLANSGIELCRKLSPAKIHELLAQLHEVASRACEESGDLAKALFHCDERVANARETHDAGLVSQALSRRAVLYIARGFPRDALLNADESLAFARLHDDPAKLTFSLLRRSLCFQMLGEGEASIVEAREALENAQRLKDARLTASALERLITALSIQLGLHEALGLTDRALDFARKSGPRTEAVLRIRRSGVLYLAVRLDEAAEEVDIAAAMLDAPETKIGMPGLHGFSTPDLAYMQQAQRAALALAAADWDDVLRLSAAMLTGPAARADDRRGIAELFEVFGRLGRNRSEDRDGLYERAFGIPHAGVAKGLIGMGLSRDVACACAAVRTGRADAAELLRLAAERLEDQYRQTPLDTDRGFALLAQAGTECAFDTFAQEMRTRASELFELRLKSANQPRSTDRSLSFRVQSREGAG